MVSTSAYNRSLYTFVVTVNLIGKIRQRFAFSLKIAFVFFAIRHFLRNFTP